MSEHLFRMHDVARSVKSTFNIDIMVPHGVKIGNKTYPAYNKSLSTDKYGGMGLYSDGPQGDLTFEIPLENGHRVHVVASNDSKSVDGLRDIKAACHTSVAFPHENGTYDFIIESHPIMRKDNHFTVPEHGTTDDLAVKLDNWSKRPGSVLRDKSPERWTHYQANYSARDKELVPAEELPSYYEKHRKNRIDHANDIHPNTIRVSNLENKNRFWDYNISTEEFKQLHRGD